MKSIKIVAALFAMLFTAVVGGAVWYPFIPLSDHAMTLGVDPNWEPVWRTYNFYTNDEYAISWLRFVRDLESHHVEWRWISPDGRVYARSFGTVPPKARTSGHWDGKVWSALKIKGCDPENMPGLWRVEILRDYRKVQTECFTIGGQRATC
jgi:hypothetical protein